MDAGSVCRCQSGAACRAARIAAVGSRLDIGITAGPSCTGCRHQKGGYSGADGELVCRNVLGIAASILFFIGLIVFAVWIYKDISNVVKVILMYAISTGITTAGILLARRRRNTFTLILSGCGSGLLFISILLTHVHFGYFNDIVTFGLLLLWLIGRLSAVKTAQLHTHQHSGAHRHGYIDLFCLCGGAER